MAPRTWPTVIKSIRLKAFSSMKGDITTTLVMILCSGSSVNAGLHIEFHKHLNPVEIVTKLITLLKLNDSIGGQESRKTFAISC